MRQDTNPPLPPSILFSFSDAVDEAKPKESARQDEGKEEPEADQEHAWTLRNGFPRCPHLNPVSPALSQLHSEVSSPILLTGVSLSSPTYEPYLSLSLCGKH